MAGAAARAAPARCFTARMVAVKMPRGGSAWWWDESSVRCPVAAGQGSVVAPAVLDGG
ncbi:MAG TPA: hypothetical protein VHH34_16420 [Pseudonocardiaceae bacterium]|nr:hypothetical protein [Pseudonocardiaceae bacterium]